MIERNGHTTVHLLGVQPGSLRPGAALSSPVAASLESLVEVLTTVAQGSVGPVESVGSVGGDALAC
jgi:hypothetical protein